MITASPAHPIPPEVVRAIQAELRQLEIQHQMVILLAAESGSRAWGFASTDSDYDVRFIYSHPTTRYLQLDPPKGSLVVEVEATSSAPGGRLVKLDLVGWEAHKAAKQARKCNPQLLEWLGSPVQYDTQPRAALSARMLTGIAHSAAWSLPMLHHYHGMAVQERGKLRQAEQRGPGGGGVVRLKTLLYTVRPLLCLLWLEQTIARQQAEQQHAAPGRLVIPPPPVVFDTLYQAVAGGLPSAVRAAIETLVAAKRASASETATSQVLGESAVALRFWIDEQIAAIDARRVAREGAWQRVPGSIVLALQEEVTARLDNWLIKAAGLAAGLGTDQPMRDGDHGE
jgi:predicted nucleotidyltransferase